MKKILFTLSLLLMPLVSFAQGVDDMLTNLVSVLSSVVIPFLFGIAFLFFVINVFRFFILGGHNKDSQEKAKSLAIYGILAFVFLIIFWGIINMLASSIGLEGHGSPKSDYVDDRDGGSHTPPYCPPEGGPC